MVPSKTPPATSVILAILNEAGNIDEVIDLALSDDAVIEVIVVDGGSTDTTVDKVLARVEADDRVTLLHNPDRVQAVGLNMAASAASGTLLVRLDGHSRYAHDYITASLAAWHPGTAVGGPMTAEGSSPWEGATANAMADPLAIGPARFHHADSIEEVDTVYLGTFERSTFVTLGGYRAFPSGTVEDTDFYERWRAHGGTVLVDPSIRSWYKPRDTWRGLIRQYFRYGRGKAELVWLNGRLPSMRPLAPGVLVAAFGVFGIVAVVSTWVPLAAVGMAWIVALVVVASRASSRRALTALVAGTMHLAYGAGLWWGLLAGRPNVKTLGLQPRHGREESSDLD